MTYNNHSNSASSLLKETVIQRVFNIEKIAKAIKAEHLLRDYQPPFVQHKKPPPSNKHKKPSRAPSMPLLPSLHYNNINDNVLISNTLPPDILHQFTFVPQLNHTKIQAKPLSDAVPLDNIVINSDMMSSAKNKTRNVSIGSFGFGCLDKRTNSIEEQKKIQKDLNIHNAIKLKRRMPRMSFLGNIARLSQKYSQASHDNNKGVHNDKEKEKEKSKGGIAPIMIIQDEDETESQIVTERYNETKKEGPDTFLTMTPSFPIINHKPSSLRKKAKIIRNHNLNSNYLTNKEHNTNIINSNNKVSINFITSSIEEYLPCTKIIISKNSSGKSVMSIQSDSSYNRIKQLDEVISNLLDRNR